MDFRKQIGYARSIPPETEPELREIDRLLAQYEKLNPLPRTQLEYEKLASCLSQLERTVYLWHSKNMPLESHRPDERTPALANLLKTVNSEFDSLFSIAVRRRFDFWYPGKDKAGLRETRKVEAMWRSVLAEDSSLKVESSIYPPIESADSSKRPMPSGSSADFKKRMFTQIGRIMMSRGGRELIDSILENRHTVTIRGHEGEKYRTKTKNKKNSQASSPILDSDPEGPVYEGLGSDATVYSPAVPSRKMKFYFTQSPNPRYGAYTIVPEYLRLAHELGHAMNAQYGKSREHFSSKKYGIDIARWTNPEEKYVIEKIDNPMRRELNLPNRIGHISTGPLLEEYWS
ncbi:M91 family zinc metallopeptidase [Fulvitalea axinellae]